MSLLKLHYARHRYGSNHTQFVIAGRLLYGHNMRRCYPADPPQYVFVIRVPQCTRREEFKVSNQGKE